MCTEHTLLSPASGVSGFHLNFLPLADYPLAIGPILALGSAGPQQLLSVPMFSFSHGSISPTPADCPSTPLFLFLAWTSLPVVQGSFFFLVLSSLVLLKELSVDQQCHVNHLGLLWNRNLEREASSGSFHSSVTLRFTVWLGLHELCVSVSNRLQGLRN